MKRMREAIIRKMTEGDFSVGVIGLGYVGLPLLVVFAENGISAVGFDIDKKKVEKLNNYESYIKHLPSERLRTLRGGGKFEATDDFSRIASCDGIIITVPTPLTVNREPDTSYISSSCEAIVPYLRRGQVVILGSTTYPGTTEEIVVPILEKSGLTAGVEFYVGYSPEREDPSNKNFSTSTIPKVVGATTEEGLDVAVALYKHITETVVPVNSVKVAEASKLLENIFRAVNIGLVNELKIAFMKMDIDVWEVIEAASTKPFGFMPFFPGPGLGGHCIPIDPFYLTWKAREYGINTKFIELAGEVNTAMPNFVVNRVMEVLNEHDKHLKGSNILMMGLAYKPNVDDARESPGYYLMRELEQRGAKVSYNDPHIPTIGMTRAFSDYAGRKSVEINGDYDLILIVTAHDEYLEMDLSVYDVPVVDTRNILKGKSDLYYKA